MTTANNLKKYLSATLIAASAFLSLGAVASAQTMVSIISNAPLVPSVPEMTGNLSTPFYQAHSVSLFWKVASPTYDKGAYYDIRYSTSLITEENFSQATQVTGAPIPTSMLSITEDTGRVEIVSGLSQGTTYYFALKSRFGNGDWSPRSDVPSLLLPVGTPDTVQVPMIDLSFGKTNTDVGNLQKFLAVKGFYSGPVTNHFGPLTKAAVIAFQAKNNIIPSAGYVGPITRASMKTMVVESLSIHN